jgi:toxin ParE1/3/4
MTIVWSRRAVRHLEALRNYIAEDNPKSAQRLVQRILNGLNLLVNQPHSGRPGRVTGTREFIVPGTSYIIPYRVRGERIELIAVFHGRRLWPKKL